MNTVYICELCQNAFEPIEINGVRTLPEYLGYTVDLRLQQFRKMEIGHMSEFIEFESDKGQRLLNYLHRQLTN